MKSFYQGEVFNGATISHARCAAKNALFVWGIDLLHRLGFSLILNFSVNPPSSTGSLGLSSEAITLMDISENIGWVLKFGNNVFYGLMFFGLIYLFVWALKIGRDLNEESELTV
jgi:hypothetical protein